MKTKLLLGLMLLTSLTTESLAKTHKNDSLFNSIGDKIKVVEAELDQEIMANKAINHLSRAIILQSSKYFADKIELIDYLETNAFLNQAYGKHIFLAKESLKKAKKVKNRARSCRKSLENLKLARDELARIHRAQAWMLVKIKEITRGQALYLRV